ncbi:MAG: glycosyltransferase family 4 protein [Anaerolineae bacterium]
MRIGMITGEYPPMEGGVGDFTRQLSLALRDRDHGIHVLTSELAAVPKGRSVEDGLMVHRKITNWGWGSLRQIEHWASELNCDIVNLQYQAAAYGMKGWINLLPGQLSSSAPPLVVTYHDLLPPYLFPKAGPLRQWTVWYLARQADGAIATNRQDYQALSQALGDQATPIREIPIGSNIAACPPSNYDRRSWREQHGFSTVDIVIGYFGLVNRSKGIETLLQSLAALIRRGYPVHLLMIGGSPGTSDTTNVGYAAEIQALIRQLGLEARVHRTGFLPPPEVSAAFYAVDVCALPYRDGASLRRGTLHAALQHGRAIVSTVPALPIPEFEDGRNILFVPPDDPKALSEAILTLALDHSARDRLGARATELAKRFSWATIAAQT